MLTLPEHIQKLENAKKLIEAKTNSPFNLRLITLNYFNSKSVSAPSGTVDYKDMISDNVQILDIKPSRTLNDVAFLPYSSGTTGLSKGVQLTHRNVIANFQQVLHPEIGHIQMASSKFMRKSFRVFLLRYRAIYYYLSYLLNLIKNDMGIIFVL